MEGARVTGHSAPPRPTLEDEARVRAEFDEIARLSAAHGGGDDRYDRFLSGLIPAGAKTVLDVGCGTGRLAASLATPGRKVLGIDLSPGMISEALKREAAGGELEFRCGQFFTMEFPEGGFDCVISSAVLHHMPLDEAVGRMIGLLAPGGVLVIHDMRSDGGLYDRCSSAAAGVFNCASRLFRTGRLFEHRALHEAWIRHGSGDTWFTMRQVREYVARLLPGAVVWRHFYWRCTVRFVPAGAPMAYHRLHNADRVDPGSGVSG